MSKVYAHRDLKICTKDCLCLFVCPTGATNNETGQIDKEKCIGCGACASACPAHAITLLPRKMPPAQQKTKAVCASLKQVIKNKVKEMVDSTDKDVVIEAALIMRSKIPSICSSLIYVNAKTSDIIKRMRKTRNISETEARKRLKMQRDVKNNRFDADILINNMKDYNNLIMISKKLGRYYGVKSKSKCRRKRRFY